MISPLDFPHASVQRFGKTWIAIFGHLNDLMMPFQMHPAGGAGLEVCSVYWAMSDVHETIVTPTTRPSRTKLRKIYWATKFRKVALNIRLGHAGS